MSITRPFLLLSRRTALQAHVAPKPAFATRSLATNDTMNLTDLVDSIAEEHELSKAEAKRIVSSVFDNITEAVASKKKVSISNFGSFEAFHVESRVGRNPQTGAELTISARERVKFKPFTHFKEVVNKK